MKDIWKITQNLNVFIYHHIYKEATRKIDCLTKKGIYNLEYFTWRSNFPKDVIKFSLEDYYGFSFNQMCRYSTL